MKCNNPLHKDYNGKECVCIDCEQKPCPFGGCTDCNGPVKYRCEPPDMTEGGCGVNLTHFSLFSGIGGIDLASEWAGFQTVGQCEYADYPTKVLEKHWPDVPRWRDVKDVTAESVRARGIRNITLISGGFPCQPFSVAGKQRGREDDRFLWPEMCRVISELRPAWVLGENVPGIIPLALDQVLIDLENFGYSCQAFNIPACAVDAPHRRARIFIVAWDTDSKHERKVYEIQEKQRVGSKRVRQDVANSSCKLREWTRRTRVRGGEPSNGSEDVGNTNGIMSQGLWTDRKQVMGTRYEERQFKSTSYDREHCWPTEPDVGRVAYGVPNRVDRLKCLGNAVVPQQVYPILKAIADIENGVIS